MTSQLDHSHAALAARGLGALSDVVLDDAREAMLQAATALNLGPAAWRRRKAAESRELLALSWLAPHRLTVDFLEMSLVLRVIVRLIVPVPCLAEGPDPVIFAREAVLGLSYPPEVLRTPLPGYAFVEILEPHGVYHPNVAAQPQQGQRLCLGVTLPAGVRMRELVLSTYGALSGQTMRPDALDPAGVLNPVAARFFEQNMHRLPFSKVPFLGIDDANPQPANTSEESS